MVYPEFSQSKKAEQNAITDKYNLDKQKEIKFDSITPEQSENIKQLANVYSFAPAGLLTTLGKNGLSVEEAEPYILSYVNNYANDGRTIRKNARDYQLSNAGIYSWLDKLEVAGKKAAQDDRNVFERTKGQFKKFVQVASTGAIAFPQFATRLVRTYMIARNEAIDKAVAEGQDISYTKGGEKYLDVNKAFTNPVFMKEFYNQIKPQYIAGKEDLTKDFIPFFEGGPAFEKAGPTALTSGFEQFGDKLFDLETPGDESGLGNSWFPYFGQGSEAWDEANRRGQLYAKFKGSAFSPTTESQPVTPGGIVAGEFVDANTNAYRNISGIIDGLFFIRGDLFNKLQTVSQNTIQRYKQFGLIKEVGKDGVTRLKSVDRDKAFNYFMKSDEGNKIMKAWAENLDDTNLIVKNFTPNMSQDLIIASKLPTLKQKEQAVKNAFQKWVLQDPKGMPNMPQGYQWNKTVESIGLNKIFNNMSNKEKDTARRLWGDWTPKDTFVWQNQSEVIENTRRFIINARIPAEKGNRLLASFVNATLQNTNPGIGYTTQKQVFNKILDAAGEAMTEAKERPDVIESFLDITKGNLKGFSTENVGSYWVSDILSWHNVKTATQKTIQGIEGVFPGQRAKLDDLGKQIIIDGQPQKVPTPHLAQQLLKESITVPDMRSIRNSTGRVSKGIRNIELMYGKKIAQGIDKYFDKDLVDTKWFEKSRIIDSPRTATRSLINLLWGVQKGIWTPLQLITRIAFPVRITSDGQAKLAADGYPSLFKHPMEYFGLLLGKNNKTLAGEVITKTEAFHRVSRDNTRLYFGDNVIENLKKGYDKYNITDALQNPKLKKQYLTAVLEEIKLLNLGKLTNIVADNIINNIDEASLAKRLFRGDLDELRLDYQTSLLDDNMTPGNALSTYEKTLAYVDTLYQRVKEVTNDPAILKFIASGSDSLDIVNKKGATETLKIIDVPQGSTISEMLQTAKRQLVDDKKFYKYLEDSFDEISPLIRQEIEKGGEPIFMGFPLIQQGRPSLKLTDIKEAQTQIKKVLDAAVTGLFEFPAGIERWFNRSPLYRTVRGKSYGDGYMLLPENLQKEFLENLEKLPKMFSTKLKNDKFIKGMEKFFDLDALNKSTKEIILEAVEEAKTRKPPEGVQLFESLEELEQFVDARALFLHNNLLFNLSERGYFADVTRLMYPFMGAYIEQATTWTGVLSRNPFAIRKTGLVVNGAEQEGWITEGPNGEKYFSYPWIGPAVEGKYFYDQSQRIKINAMAPLQAINMVTQGSGPGAGPILQIPAGVYIPDKPEFDLLQKHFNPFGVKVTDAESFKKFGKTYLLPSYMVKAITAWSEGEGFFADEYLWNTHLVQTAKALAVTGFYINDAGQVVSITNEAGAIDQEKLLQGAKEVGTKTLLVRAFNQFYLPAGFSYDYRLRTDAQSVNDYKEYFGEDVEIGIDGEGYLRFTAIMSVYNNLKSVFDGNDEAAILAMTEILGPDWLSDKQGIEPLTYLTRGSSYNEAGIRSTTEDGFNWERNNANLEEYLPDVFGLFAPAPMPGADYSYEARFIQIRKGNIVKLTNEEWAEETQKIAGSRMWSYLTTMEAKEKGRELTPSEKGKIFSMVDTMFPNWYVKSITLSQDVTRWNEIEQAVGIDVRGKDKLPDDILKQIQESPLYEPLKEYMDAREETLVEIGQLKDINNKYGAPGTSQQYYLKNTILTQPYRRNLKKIGERLSNENAEFAIFWNLIGSKELNQEYYEDREGNLLAVLEELED
jgi:hypothetical protein